MCFLRYMIKVFIDSIITDLSNNFPYKIGLSHVPGLGTLRLMIESVGWAPPINNYFNYFAHCDGQSPCYRTLLLLGRKILVKLRFAFYP